MNDLFKDAEVISVYSREQAIADGVLADVSRTKEALEAGFRVQVCLSEALSNKVSSWPEGEGQSL